MDGFTITIMNQKLKVRFLHPNNKAIICFIDDGNEEFKGVSKCNYDAGDEYDISNGEEKALEKALEKRNKYYENVIMRIEIKLSKKVEAQENAIMNHWLNKTRKLKDKAEICEYMNAQEEIPPIEAYQNICLMGR